MRASLAALMLAMAATGASAATTIYPGKWSFVFEDAKGRPDRPIKVYTFRPKVCDTKCPIYFVIAGARRNASFYRDDWEPLANEGKFIVVAPEFLDSRWPGAAAYNLGDVKASEDREKWTFSAIEHLFDEIRDGQASYRIFGHSAGGQFVMRMAMFRPDARASIFVAGNPGWYTLPEWRPDKTKLEWPYSLVKARVGAPELQQALARRVVVLHTERDDEPDADKEYPNADQRKAAPASRVARGEAFFQALDTASAELGTPPPAWELVKLPDNADVYAIDRYAAQKVK